MKYTRISHKLQAFDGAEGQRCGGAGERVPSFSPAPLLLTGVGFLQLGGVKAEEIVNRSRRKRTPAMKMNRKVIE
ncbi:hypothetical protein, partial [Anabaena sp. FACHB-83]|uniref:hypothetical protein n=1 Tax=Anabaena sp. FACHB-83 TaxID=2692772 RepID=UPI001A7ED4D6